MKKNLTLFAAALFAGSMMAEDPTMIKFESAQSATEVAGSTYGSNGFTLVIPEGSDKAAIDASGCTFGFSAEETISFTHRLKTVGASNKPGRIFTLNVPEEGDLIIYARTATTTDLTRNFVIANGADTIVNHICLDTDTVVGASSKIFLPIIVENVPAGTYAVTYPVNGINFFGFELQSGEEDDRAGELLCTLDFPDHNDAKISNYTSTWTATVNGKTWTITGFSNNSNAWGLIKCGRKDVTSVASIETPALKASVTSIVYDFAAVANVDSAFLYTMMGGSEVLKTPVTLTAGVDSFCVTDSKSKNSYKLEIYCASASSNGPVQLNSVTVYGTPDQNAVEDPTFSLAAGEYYDAQKVALACATEGAEIRYTLDESMPTETSTLYTDSIVISENTTIMAIAFKNHVPSDVVENTYIIAAQYSSLTELVNAGMPIGEKVVVTLTNETIDSIYVTKAGNRNGIYLTAAGRMVEIYCYGVPAEWKVGGTVSGVVKGEWKEYLGTWEVCPADWDGITYTAPAPTAIDAVATEPKAIKIIENGQVVIIRDGKKFNAVGTKL